MKKERGGVNPLRFLLVTGEFLWRKKPGYVKIKTYGH